MKRTSKAINVNKGSTTDLPFPALPCSTPTVKSRQTAISSTPVD